MYNKTILIKDTGPVQDLTREYYAKLMDLLRDKNLEYQVQVVRVSEIGMYGRGGVVKILPDDVLYAGIKESDLKRIIDNTVINGAVLDDLSVKKVSKQLRLVLRNCGVINPESIEEYIAADGYFSLKKALLEDHENEKSDKDFGKDIIPLMLHQKKDVFALPIVLG